MRARTAPVLAVALTLCNAAIGDLVYNIVDLGTLDTPSRAYAINDLGQVAGSSFPRETAYKERAAVFGPDGSTVMLETRGSRACSINESGQAVGNVGIKPVLFDSTGNGNTVELGRGEASAINDKGQIVGSTNNVACLFDGTGNGNNITLGTLGGAASTAYGINNIGEIVGHSHTATGGDHACLFDPTGQGNNIDLGSVGTSYAFAINDHGQIVGYDSLVLGSTNHAHACLFNRYGPNTDLGTLGGLESVARAINDLGQIVGWSYTISHSDRRATLFDPTGAGNNIDLNTLIDPTLGWRLEYAEGINNHGWITGWGVNGAGEQHAYCLRPVPLPSAALLGVLGLGTAGWRLRRTTT